MKLPPKPVWLEATAAENALKKLRVAASFVEPSRRRAVLYARYSTLNQTDDSLLRQRLAMEDYARRNDIEIVGEPFTDRATSGTREDRAGLQDALNVLFSGKADILLAEHVDRIARDTLVFAKVWHALRLNRKSLHTVSDGHLESQVLSMLKSAMSADEVEKTRDRSNSNMRLAVVNKGSVSGVAFGYDKVVGESGKRQINEAEMEIYDLLCDLYLDGLSYQSIADYLNDEKFPSPGDSDWKQTTIRGILLNPIYAGVYLHGRRRADKKTDSATVEKAHPDLARDAERWARMAAERERRATTRMSINWEHDVLHGVLRCGSCCELMTRVGQHKTGRRGFHCYRTDACVGGVDAVVVQDMVVRTVVEIVRAGDWAKAYERYKRAYFGGAISKIDNELAKKRAKVSELVEAVADAALDSWRPEWSKELRERTRVTLENRLADTERRVRQLEADQKAFDRDDARLEDLDVRLKALVERGLPREVTRESIGLLGEIRRAIPEIVVRNRRDVKALEFHMRFVVREHEDYVEGGVLSLRRHIFYIAKRGLDDPYMRAVTAQLKAGRWAVTPAQAARMRAEIKSFGWKDVALGVAGVAMAAQTGLSPKHVDMLLGLPRNGIGAVLSRIKRREGLDRLREAYDRIGSRALGTIPLGYGQKKGFWLAELGPVDVTAFDASTLPPPRPRRPRTGGRRAAQARAKAIASGSPALERRRKAG